MMSAKSGTVMRRYRGPQGPTKEYRLLAGIYVTNEREARELGETVRSAAPFENPAENLTVFARKI
jgi:hypothetical protein